MSLRCAVCQRDIPDGQSVRLPLSKEKRISWANALQIPASQLADRSHNSFICSSHFPVTHLNRNAFGSVLGVIVSAVPKPYVSNFSQNRLPAGYNPPTPTNISDSRKIFTSSKNTISTRTLPYSVTSKSSKSSFTSSLQNEVENEDCDSVEMVLIDKKLLLSIFKVCPYCGNAISERVQLKLHTVGTAGVIKYNCSKCPTVHKTWSSQTKIGGSYRGNALVANAAMVTPLSYPTLKEFFELAKIPIFSSTTFSTNNKKYVWPVIKTHYEIDQAATLEKLKQKQREGKSIQLAMDCQYDSPGYCAQLATATAIETDLGLIVASESVHKTMTDNKSPRMEQEGIKRVMESLKSKGVVPKTVTTDRHTAVIKYIREECPDVTHLFDAWHMVKPLKSALREKTKMKKYSELKGFTKMISNHMLYSINVAQGDGEYCREIMLSCLFHLLGIHQWKKGNISRQLETHMKNIVKNRKGKVDGILPVIDIWSDEFKKLEFKKLTGCLHPPFGTPDDHEYMNPCGHSYFFLTSKITAKQYITDIVKLSPDLATSKVENYHSLATNKYKPKKIYFPYEGYCIRTMLSVLDYNNHSRCEQNGEVKVIKTIRRPSKAHGGELVNKNIKNKAPIDYKHNIVMDCLNALQNGQVRNLPIPDFAVALDTMDNDVNVSSDSESEEEVDDEE